MKANLDLQSFQDASALGEAAARDWLDLLSQAPNAPFFAALSGGGGAAVLFSELARKKSLSLLANVHFFWADERCVPPTDRESNFLLADEMLFQPLQISPTKIHRIQGELSANAAVEAANAEIGGVVPSDESGLPVFDLVFLGMGPDGHIASLFPNAPVDLIHCRDAYLSVKNSPKPPPKRISLSYAALAAAKKVWVLAPGAGKEQALTQSLEPNALTPLAQLLELRHETRILTDFAVQRGKEPEPSAEGASTVSHK